eukprot:759210-Hanusia_phi.AAC.2
MRAWLLVLLLFRAGGGEAAGEELGKSWGRQHGVKGGREVLTFAGCYPSWESQLGGRWERGGLERRKRGRRQGFTMAGGREPFDPNASPGYKKLTRTENAASLCFATACGLTAWFANCGEEEE